MKKITLYLFIFALLIVYAGCSASPQNTKADTPGRYQDNFGTGSADLSLITTPPVVDHRLDRHLNQKEVALPRINWFSRNPSDTSAILGFRFKIRSIMQDETSIGSFSELTRKLKGLVPIFLVEYSF